MNQFAILQFGTITMMAGDTMEQSRLYDMFPDEVKTLIRALELYQYRMAQLEPESWSSEDDAEYIRVNRLLVWFRSAV